MNQEQDERLAVASVQFAEARARVWDELSYLLHTHGRSLARVLLVAVERYALGERCEVCEGACLVAGASCAGCHGRGWTVRKGPL